jgi:hypothetical protein
VAPLERSQRTRPDQEGACALARRRVGGEPKDEAGFDSGRVTLSGSRGRACSGAVIARWGPPGGRAAHLGSSPLGALRAWPRAPPGATPKRALVRAGRPHRVASRRKGPIGRAPKSWLRRRQRRRRPGKGDSYGSHGPRRNPRQTRMRAIGRGRGRALLFGKLRGELSLATTRSKARPAVRRDSDRGGRIGGLAARLTCRRRGKRPRPKGPFVPSLLCPTD